MVHSVGRQQPGGILPQQRDLLLGGDGERVDAVVRHPGGIGVDRFVGQVDPLGVERGQCHRHAYRVACGIGGDIRAQSGVGGETPGAVHDHPHSQTHLAVQYRRLQLSVTQLHDLGGDGVDPQVSVASPAGGRRRERRVGQSGTWQRKKILVDAVPRAHGSTVTGWPPGQSAVRSARTWRGARP